MLRVTGCVFLGWGRRDHDDEPEARQAREEGDEEAGASGRTPPLMIIVPAVLLAGAIVIGLIPGVVPAIETAAYRFHDHAAYARWVLGGELIRFPSAPTSHLETYDYLYAGGAVVGALAMAALGLFGSRLPAALPHGLVAGVAGAVNGFRALHSGHIGDYITWLTMGAAVLGAMSLLLLT